MLRNNKVNAVIAFVAAVFLWIYVVGQVNPETTGRISGIPVVFAGEEVLEDNDLALVDPGELTVDIVVRGNRSDVRKVISNSDRITAVANVAGLSKGTHDVSLDITVPSSVDLQKQSMDDVVVEVDDLAMENIAVEIRYEGTFAESQEAVAAAIDPAVITVTGAASTVDTIDHLEAVIPVSELTDKTTTISADVLPVTEYGQEVEHVKLAASKVDVTVGLVETATAALKVETEGTPADGYEVEKVTCPETVKVKGPHSALEGLTEITAAPVDVTGLSEDTTVTLDLNLPDGVELVEPKTVEAVVQIAGVSSMSFTYSTSEITVDDVPEGMAATTDEQTITVTVNAEKAVLDALKKKDIQLHVSAAELPEGEHELAITVISDLEEKNYTVDPEKVVFKITAVESEETGEQE